MNFKLKIILYLIGFKINRWWYGKDLAKLRDKRFKKFIRQLKDSPYYQPFLKKEMKLTDFPVIDKSVFMSEFNTINTAGIRLKDAYEIAAKAETTRDFSPTINGVTIGLSSGTTGNRGVFLASTDERARWVACILDRVIGFSFKKRKVAFFLRANSNLYQSVQSSLLEFHYFDLFDPIAVNINKLQATQPHILVAQPSMLVEVAKAIEQKQLKIQPGKVISVAEVLTPEDKEYLQHIFNQTLHQAYQCTEGFLACTCSFGTLHFNEDFLCIEKKYIDEERKRFHPIVTDLIRTLQPVIRYELNDIIIEKEICACGNKALAIEQIEGRSDDVLVFESLHKKPVKIFPDFFRKAIIMADSSITDYAVTQRSPGRIDLFIRSSHDEGFDLATRAIRNLLEQYDVRGVDIVRVHTNNHLSGNKLRRIKNVSGKIN